MKISGHSKKENVMGLFNFPQVDSNVNVIEVKFTNAYCIRLHRSISIGQGISTILTISPETLTVQGVDFDNRWV